MGYTNSPLVSYTKLSPNHSGQRTHSIDRITPHCVVGQCSVESLGNVFANPSRQASSNYGIGVDGRVGMYVEEKNRSWCSSSNANDQRAVTIECASDNIAPYAFKDVVYAKLVDLCVDICQRNGKNKILWFPTKDQRLNYNPQPNEIVFTLHRDLAATQCPGQWLVERMADLADKVNAKLSGSTPTPSPTPTPSNPFPPCPITTTEQNEKAIWDYLMGKLNNAYGTAGMMGNLFAESSLRPENLQNTFEKRLGMSDTQYADAVNNGSYTNFVHDSAGWGLAQWTFWSRKDGLQKLMKQRNKPIYDLNTQLDWLWQELNTSYKGTLNIIKNATTVQQASDEVLVNFEHPGAVDDPNKVGKVKAQRLEYSMIFYNRYSGSTPTPQPTPTPTPTPTGSYVFQGVDYSPVFEPNYYSDKYSDLKKAFGNDAKALFNHFTTYGMKEARQAIATFNPIIYRSKYKDLQDAFGSNWPEYYKHYCVYGIKEGRSGV